MIGTCLILSAGEQRRFTSDCPKQLFEMGGETIMARQLRQLSERGIDPIVVCLHPKILERAKVSFQPAKSITILHTLVSTRSIWRGRVIVLLGDVFYSGALLDSIIANELPIRFWLTGSEIFALAFGKNEHDRIAEALAGCFRDTPGGGERGRDGLRLWHLYRIVNSLPIHQHKVVEGEKTGDLVCDYTFDVDSQKDAETKNRSLSGQPRLP